MAHGMPADKRGRTGETGAANIRFNLTQPAAPRHEFGMSLPDRYR